MSLLNNYPQQKFGIDEVYFRENLDPNLLEKLHQRAIFSLDAEDNIVVKHASQDMILIFHQRDPNRSLIYRFLKFLDQHPDKDKYIESHTLLNEEELFSAIKSKKFVLITPKFLSKEMCSPNKQS